MQVGKYKKKRDGKYLVTFSGGREIELYEDVILKYELLLKKQVDPKMVNELLSFQQECDVYYVALKYLKARLRSCKEIFDLLKKREYPQDLIDKAIEKLLVQSYLDDHRYASSFLHEQIVTTSRGPNKIAYELEKKGISREIIVDVLSSYTKEIELQKIQKIVNRMMKSNRNKSSLMLKKKIESELLYQGFDRANISLVMSDISFCDDASLYEREYEKLYQKLSRKYSGDVLAYKIKQKLYQKGFRNEN